MKNLRASLPATMAGIAARSGLRLAFGQPRTDGKTVWVSDIPLNPSQEDYNSVVSDLIHEIGHVRFTDFSLNRGGHPLMPALTNVFEDVRIERELEREFLGAKSFLNEGYKVGLSKGQQRRPDTPANALSMWLILDHMIKVNGRNFFAQSRDEAYQACLGFGVGADLLKEVEDLCDARVSKLSSTADVITLSKDVVALLQQSQQEEEEEQQQQSQSQCDSGSGDSQDGDSQDGDSQDGDSQDGDSQDGDSQDGDSGSGDSDKGGSKDQPSSSQQDSESQGSESSDSSEPGDKASSKGDSTGAKQILESDVGEKSPISLREAAEEASKASDGLRSLLGDSSDIANELSQSNGSGSQRNYSDSEIAKDLPNYNVVKASLSKDIQVLRTKLVKNWQSKAKTRSILNENDGRFSVSDAIRCAASGEDNYLIKKGKTTNYKPAICVLADLSGSMGHKDDGSITRLAHQTRALIALVEACGAIGIPLNILGFDDKLIPLKTWNTPITQARATLGGLTPFDSTRLDLAVFEGIRALNTRKEGKKVLITLTDGDVGSFQSMKVKALMESFPGVEYYGIGIDVDISSIFKKGGKVSPKNLAESLLAILAQ